MQAALSSCPRTATAPLRAARAAPMRPAPVARLVTRAAAAFDADEEAVAAGVIGKEWLASWHTSWSSSASAKRSGDVARNTLARSSASEEGVDATAVLSGDWDGRSNSLFSYEDVLSAYRKKSQGRK